MIYISQPHQGSIYIAESSRRGSRKLLWSVMPEVAGADIRCEARHVPLALRRQAYRKAYAERGEL